MKGTVCTGRQMQRVRDERYRKLRERKGCRTGEGGTGEVQHQIKLVRHLLFTHNQTTAAEEVVGGSEPCTGGSAFHLATLVFILQ